MTYAQKVYACHRDFVRQCRQNLQALADVASNEDLTADARAASTRELNDRLDQPFRKQLAEARGYTEDARTACVDHLPAGCQLRAALDKPQRSADVRQLAEGSTNLRQLATMLAG